MSERPHTAVEPPPALSRAASAARAGDLDLAARILREPDRPGEPGGPGGGAAGTLALLDLRARVHAQRGELAEADACWARVQALAPDDADAAAGRRTIAEIRSGRLRARPAVRPRRAVVAAAVAGLLLAGGGAWLASGADTGAEGAQRGAPSGTDRLREELHRETRRADALQGRLDSAETAAAAAAGRRARVLDAVEERLAMPGVFLRRGDASVTVAFGTGLFPHGTVITREGAALLERIGRGLADMEVTTTVTGHTATVPGSPSSGGSALALARARVAVDHLSREGGPPLTAFTLTSGDQRGAPFPDAPRNRTVTLLVTPDERPAAH
ncbi:hypothetical protein GCM10027168_40100 [Streptomyces capparidis]